MNPTDPTDEEIARHEGAHAAMAISLGVPVRYIGLDAVGGFVQYRSDAVDHTREGAVNRMMIILAALIESADSGDDLPHWPIDPAAAPDPLRADWHMLAHLAHRLELTEDEYSQIVGTTLRLSGVSAYQQLVTAISGTLDYRPLIDAHLLEQLDAITHWRPQ